MPLPADLRACLTDPDFWRAYFFENDTTEDEDDDDYDDSSIVVEFSVGGGYGLVLDICVGLRSINLAMRTPDSSEPLDLGWDDQAHWHPDALRWAELDLIARAAAVLDHTLRHPGPVLALAGRFVVLGSGDDLDAVTPMMDAAFGTPPAPQADVDPEVPMLDVDFGPPRPVETWWPRTRDWLHRIDGRYNGVVWQQDEAGVWTVHQDEAENIDRDLYSLRGPDGDFPFAAWQELMAAAEATLKTADLPTPESPIEQCWIDEERTAAPRGSLVAARNGPSPLRDSRRYLFTLKLPVAGRSKDYPVEVRTDLNRALRQADLGWAESSGSTVIPGSGQTAAGVSIGVTGDLDSGVAVIRQVLARHRADPAGLTAGH
ncbi:hypothetical protein [Actinoplanes awajinensis]|uniref:Uncharacterized protein n=1 Tax=Actinoplanes awajinensis subsp. mycoplanecinus TaxID=135947 RepID=A0A0X3V9U9_9ACTN|nr:hypothetical protein [Actinoplanes awajinensis]KUL41468.1 hypothetical protein ADL15_04235 [Actinoplanes awajinensis subsp. mycoplanecinus]